jgi:hypothetical protein
MIGAREIHAEVYYKRSEFIFYRPEVNFPCFQKSMYYAGIRTASSAPCKLTTLMNARLGTP